MRSLTLLFVCCPAEMRVTLQVTLIRCVLSVYVLSYMGQAVYVAPSASSRRWLRYLAVANEMEPGECRQVSCRHDTSPP